MSTLQRVSRGFYRRIWLFAVMLSLPVAFFGATLLSATASAQSNLPPCGLFRWKNCLHTQNIFDGSKYVGELRDGEWHGQGTYTFSDGTKYVGEFRDGKSHGQGTLTFSDGTKYVGEFRDGLQCSEAYDERHCNSLEFHGHGTYTWPDGKKYVGEFRDGKSHGQGTEYFSDGSIGRSGMWRNDSFVESAGAPTPAKSAPSASAQSKLPPCPSDKSEVWTDCFGTRTDSFTGTIYAGEWEADGWKGQGTLLSSSRWEFNGYKYVGQFDHNRYHGQGTLFDASDGSKYVGEFNMDEKWGQGTEYAPDGSILRTGTWVNGEFVGGTKVSTPSTSSPEGDIGVVDGSFVESRDTPSPAVSSAAPSVASSGAAQVPLVSEGGTFKVPVLINGVIELHFMLDSGAADVSIPADVVMTLVRTGTLKREDFLGTRTYVLADGSKVPSQTFRIRTLKVGDRVIENVVGSVADVEGSLLLGQSFLSKLNSWSIDNSRQVLILE